MSNATHIDAKPSAGTREAAGDRVTNPTRVASIDIFRGLTMVVMIFVNELAGVKGLPWWNYHMPAKADFMTYVDMVFPAFLFAVGMSLPLSVTARRACGTSEWKLWQHIVARSAALAVLGIALANAGRGDAAQMGISRGMWGTLALLGAILFWVVYPRDGGRRGLWIGLRLSGLALMLAMFAIYRRTHPNGDVGWLSFSYWEILGIIGWTYLAVSILYIPFSKWRWTPTVLFAALLGLNVASAAKWVTFGDHLPLHVWPLNNGAFGLIVMAGVITSQIFLTDSFAVTFRGKAWTSTLFGTALFLGGWALSPLGISKIRATPTWCLFSASSSVFLFLLLYWLCDARGHTKWAAFAKAPGVNTLLTYLLPDLFYFAIGTAWLPAVMGQGLPGAVWAAVFTALMLGIAALLTRWRVRMQL